MLIYIDLMKIKMNLKIVKTLWMTFINIILSSQDRKI